MADEKDSRGAGEWSDTPVDGPATPEETARRLVAVGAGLRRAGDVVDAAAQLVREGAFDARTRDFLVDVAEHLEDLSDIAAGAGLILRRLAGTV